MEIHDQIQRFFGIKEKGSSVGREILAGLSTFLALSYIFVVNPAILSQAGIDPTSVLFATILVSAAATFVMGVWGRLPFVLAPGMEMNGYVAFFAVGTLGLTWQESLGAVFWSGVLFLVLTLIGVRQQIIDSIPDRMKGALALSVGVFLAMIALRVAGVVEYGEMWISGVGSLLDGPAIALYVSFAIVFLLDRLKFRAAILVSIVLTAVLCQFLTLPEAGQNTAEGSSFFSAIAKLDLTVIANPRAMSVILVLFLVDFYGSVAKFIGLTQSTNLMVNGKLPNVKEALLVDGGATVIGSALGTSSLTTYVESGVGIGVGGRTGLTAVVCATLMLGCFVVTPLLKYIPVVATTGALIFVGTKLCPKLAELKSYPVSETITFVVMQIVVVITFSVDKAMMIGFFGYILISMGRRETPSLFILVSAVLLAVGTLFQISN